MLPVTSLRLATAADLRVGHILCLRSDWVEQQPLLAGWTLACKAVELGERLLTPTPKYVHVAVCAGVSGSAQVTAIEESWAGCLRDEVPLDRRWDVYEFNWTRPEHAMQFVQLCAESLGSRYNYAGMLHIAEARVLHVPPDGGVIEASRICSTLVSENLFKMGYRPWGARPDLVAPSDYPGRGMTLRIEAGRTKEVI
jgi:hypothetical protein